MTAQLPSNRSRATDASLRAVRTPAEYVIAIQQTATDDAVAVAQRMTLAARAAAVSRFEDVWPAVSYRSIPTRRLLRDWYLHVYQQHLDRGLDAQASSPIDGNRAEQVFIEVRDKTGAPIEVVIDTVLTLARDAREFAGRVAAGEDQSVTIALAGRLASVFPRRPGAPVSARQEIGEQWYLRAFRAELDPLLFKLPTPRIGRAEVARVIEDLAGGRRPRSEGQTDSESRANLRRRAAWSWTMLPDHRRLLWLTGNGLDEHLFSLAWKKLPVPVRNLVEAELARSETRAEAGGDRAKADRSAAPLVAARTRQDAIRPAGQAKLEAGRALFHRGGAALPPGIVSNQPLDPVMAALDRLREATPQSVKMRGLPRHGWWTDKTVLDQAVRLRTEGAGWVQIGRELGISPKSVRHGLKLHGDLDPVFTRSTTARAWTPHQLATVAALRADGRSWDDIAALIGRSNGRAVRAAVRAHRAENSPNVPRDPNHQQPPSIGL